MKHAIRFTSLFIIIMLLAACAGAPVSEAPAPAAEAPEAEEAAEEAPAEAASDEVVTITFWDNQQTESGLSEFQQIAVDEFEAANPNIKVEVVTVPYPEYQQRLLLTCFDFGRLRRRLRRLVALLLGNPDLVNVSGVEDIPLWQRRVEEEICDVGRKFRRQIEGHFSAATLPGDDGVLRGALDSLPGALAPCGSFRKRPDAVVSESSAQGAAFSAIASSGCSATATSTSTSASVASS